MPTPIVLPAANADLYEQVADALTGDTDPTYGLLAALGSGGATSIFPNFDTPGPSADRTACPVPFVFCLDGGTRALDKMRREYRLHIEVHDELDYGQERIKGIIERILFALVTEEWRPTDQPPYVTYASGPQLESKSPLLPDERYNTNMVQVTLVVIGRDRTSNHGLSKMAGPNAVLSGD